MWSQGGTIAFEITFKSALREGLELFLASADVPFGTFKVVKIPVCNSTHDIVLLPKKKKTQARKSV